MIPFEELSNFTKQVHEEFDSVLSPVYFSIFSEQSKSSDWLNSLKSMKEELDLIKQLTSQSSDLKRKFLHQIIKFQIQKFNEVNEKNSTFSLQQESLPKASINSNTINPLYSTNGKKLPDSSNDFQRN